MGTVGIYARFTPLPVANAWLVALRSAQKKVLGLTPRTLLSKCV
jgi:hypothetical protein